MKGAVPGNNGTFLRVTDAVKGPFYPAGMEPPLPTYFAKEGDAPPPKQIVAPMPESDPYAPIIPDDPY